jgi:proteic killer suppression protein
MRRWSVEITRQGRRDFDRAPQRVQLALQEWVKSVETDGMLQVRKIRGYHDEPLHGDRRGQRSVRLSRQWRVIYTEAGDELVIVTIEEITPHAY